MIRMKTKGNPTEAPVWVGDLETVSPLLGVVCIAATCRGLLALQLTSHPAGFHARFASRLGPDDDPNQAQVSAYLSQIQEYLAGRRRRFDLPIDWSEMTPFQLKTLRETWLIPYGQLRTYRGLAGLLGNPKAARAVGSALAGNPMAIVIPCHRVVGMDRTLHGYAAPGGLDTKAWLLELEGVAVRNLYVTVDLQAPS
jgi:methylated-DNA-[protein]-cysteine S-methyltransferase